MNEKMKDYLIEFFKRDREEQTVPALLEVFSKDPEISEAIQSAEQQATTEHELILQDRELLIEEIAKRRIDELTAKGELKPITPDQEAAKLKEERERIIESLSDVTNDVKLNEWRTRFIAAHKRYQVSLGVRPCEARDCARYLTGRQRKYCSTECNSREKSRKWRSAYPDKKKDSNLKYLEFDKNERNKVQ